MISLQVFPRIRAVRTRGPDGKIEPLERALVANQIQGFRIPDRWDASEKINNIFYVMLDMSSHITDARSKSYIVARGICILQSSILSFLVNVSKCDRRNFQNWQG